MNREWLTCQSCGWWGFDVFGPCPLCDSDSLVAFDPEETP